ncbi:MAG: FAD binding domain-containing protein [Planctomycetota bacterium]|nr:FAD binding domain-containing protein [Planctomycetota bacterium]MDP6989731.1 FAD binding domain-containing protein [Planctomycetota bacterium]
MDEALALLADGELAARAIAGCTDVLASDAAAGRVPPAVVDLSRLAELRDIRTAGEEIDIGAAVTFAELRADRLVRRHLPALAEAAATIGAWQIQNRATLGGNAANASPAGDSLPVLLALGARLDLASAAGARSLAYDDFHLDYRRTALGPGELIVRLRLPVPPPGSVQRFEKVGTRSASAISKVVVAFAARRRGACIEGVRLAAGSVGPVPRRLEAAEAVLEGATPATGLAEAAAAAAAAEVRPIDDVRSTAAYRRWVLGRLVRRWVLDLTGPDALSTD